MRGDLLRPSTSTSICPWKDTATYWSVEVDGRVEPDAAWSYREPEEAAAQIRGRVAFYRGVVVTA